MDHTANLRLPYIAAAQAQKHVTHNEAIRALDCMVQLSVIDRDLSTPPLSPADGDRYIVAAAATGEWASYDNAVAAFQDGAWAYHAPRTGWLAWVADEAALVSWNGSSWIATGGGGGASVNPTALVGVNATADTTNRLAVASAASLLSHDGDDHRLKVNKATAPDTASLLFQTAFSGRAEFGLTGDDDVHVKVSPDGTTWHDAIVIDRTTGEVALPNTALGGGGGGSSPPQFNCRLNRTSATEIALQPFGGSLIWIDGDARVVPAAGITLSNSGLGAGVVRNVYAYWTGSAIALELSTTGWSNHSTLGYPVKTGDPTRTLVGKVCGNASSQYEDTASNRLVISYWQRKHAEVTAIGAAAAVAADAWTEVSTANRRSFLSWGGMVTVGVICLSYHGTAGLYCYASVGFGTVEGTYAGSPGGIFAHSRGSSLFDNLSHAATYQVAEGRVFTTLRGGTASGTANYAGSYSNYYLGVEI